MNDKQSFFQRVFGTGKKGEKEPTPQEAIQRLREIEEMLMKKSDFLEKKVDSELATAKKNGTKNKRGKEISLKLENKTNNNQITKYETLI
jgi:charged multivesicular body protein 4